MIKRTFFALLASTALIVSCNNDDDATAPTTKNLTLNLQGLENLGTDYVYEGWIMVNNAPVTTGVFTVDDNGTLSQTSFVIDSNMLDNATAFVLSIEPANDTDPAPSNTKILSGGFSGNSASVNSNAMVADFANASGKYILATPTDGPDNNEASGVWFLDNSGDAPVAGLTLPTLQGGWVYEGWVVIDGQPVSTGTFTDVASADNNASTSMFKGDVNNGPGYPGEDFIQNAPNGLTFPTDLKGKTVVISVEPSPDNSANPFTIKPLAQMVPADAAVHSVLNLGDGPVKQLAGTVTR